MSILKLFNRTTNLKLKNNDGFTMIELLIIISIISILALMAFVSINPLNKFRDSRDTNRWSDVSSLLNTIKVNQMDNNGAYLANISAMVADEWYMIVDGSMNIGCEDNNTNCDIDIAADNYCVDLSPLVTAGYLGDIPISPNGLVSWDDGSDNGEEGTGYAIKRDTTGVIHVQACESENTTEILMSK